MHRLRIACVVDEPMGTRDTLTVQVAQTLSALVRAGASVDLYTPVKPGQRPDPEALRAEWQDRYQTTIGFAIYPLPGTVTEIRAIDKPAQALLAARQSTDRSYDLLYARIALPVFAALGRRHPVLYETYRPLTRQFPLLKHVFRWASRRRKFLGLVTHSNYTRDRFIADGMPADRVRTIYNGFDGRAFADRLAPARARDVLGIPNRPTFGYGGRIAPAKQLDLLLDVAERRPDLQLMLGGDADTEEARPIRERAAALPNVVFPGYLSGARFATALQACDALVIPPSRKPLEQVGNTVLPIKTFQYLAAGRGIICGDTPDTAELLLHEQTALRVEPDDSDALTAAIDRLMADEVLRTRLAENARRRAADLTWDARAGRLLGFMRERLAARG